MKPQKDIHIGKTYQSNNYGEFFVVSSKSAKKVKIKFKLTGYECEVPACRVRIGAVKDPYFPKIYGVGFLGVGKYKAFEGRKSNLCHKRWEGMLGRCYGKSRVLNAYIGVTVCEEWHNFQNFAEWFYGNYPDDGCYYELDKDIKIKGNKVYGPDACMFVTRIENMSTTAKVKFKLIDPDGAVHEFYNAAEFARNHNIKRYDIYDLNRGRTKNSNGWTKAD